MVPMQFLADTFASWRQPPAVPVPRSWSPAMPSSLPRPSSNARSPPTTRTTAPPAASCCIPGQTSRSGALRSGGDSIDNQAREAIAAARARARRRAWAAGACPGWIVMDFDATLVESHSEKHRVAPTYRRGFGFHPLVAYLDGTEKALAGLLRPGNTPAPTHRSRPDRRCRRRPGAAAGRHQSDRLPTRRVDASSRRLGVMHPCLRGRAP